MQLDINFGLGLALNNTSSFTITIRPFLTNVPCCVPHKFSNLQFFWLPTSLIFSGLYFPAPNAPSSFFIFLEYAWNWHSGITGYKMKFSLSNMVAKFLPQQTNWIVPRSLGMKSGNTTGIKVFSKYYFEFFDWRHQIGIRERFIGWYASFTPSVKHLFYKKCGSKTPNPESSASNAWAAAFKNADL